LIVRSTLNIWVLHPRDVLVFVARVGDLDHRQGSYNGSEIKLTRDHMRELDMIYGEDLRL
jgi:hypothetical protein